MTEIETITRKWGNSLGIALPKKLVDMERLQENQRVIVDIKRVADVKKLRGFIRFKKSAQKLKDEMRAGWG
jgi:antitoxin component of MazEF toxin-antitoxin module